MSFLDQIGSYLRKNVLPAAENVAGAAIPPLGLAQAARQLPTKIPQSKFIIPQAQRAVSNFKPLNLTPGAGVFNALGLNKSLGQVGNETLQSYRPGNIFDKGNQQSYMNKLRGVKLSPQDIQRNKASDELNLNLALNAGGGSEDISKAVSFLRNKIRPEDVQLIGKFAQMVEENPRQELGQIGQDVQRLGEHVFGKNSAAWGNKKLKNSFDLVLGKIGQGKNRAGLGLGTAEIQHGANPEPGTQFKGTDAQPQMPQNEHDATVLRNYTQNRPSKFIDKLKYGANALFQPVKNLPPQLQKSFGTWRSGLLTGSEEANKVAQKFASIPDQIGWKLVNYMQNPTTEQAAKLGLTPQDLQQYKGVVDEYRKVDNQLFDAAKSAGIDINYLKNHVMQMWKESGQQLEDIVARGIKTVPGFAKKRTIDSYEQGIALGLHPRYTHPAQIIAAATEELHKVLANKSLYNDLLKSGKLLPEGQSQLGYQKIEAPYFPKTNVQTGQGQSVLQGYTAPPDVASVLNNVFGRQDYNLQTLGTHPAQTLLHWAGHAASKMQEAALSVGVPGTPLHTFGIGQTMKEAAAGRLGSPIAASIRSLSSKATEGFFKENQQYVDMMAKQGIPLRREITYKNAFKNIFEKKSVLGNLKDLYAKVYTKPTFGRFLPMLQTSFFKDVYNSNLNKYGADKAAQVASESTKNFYGLVDDLASGRGQQVTDGMKVAFMAPKFRESVINVLGKTAESVFNPKTWGNPAYNNNRKLVAGALLTYGMYDVLNQQSTGHHIWENPKGKEMYLMMKDPFDPNTTMEIPFFPSFTAVPREVGSTVSSLAQGDIPGAVSSASTLASEPLSILGQLGSNKRFTGQRIYIDQNNAKKGEVPDNPLQRLGKEGAFLAGSANPLIGAPIDIATNQATGGTGGKPVHQAATSALGLPLYYTNTAGLDKNQAYTQAYQQAIDAGKGATAAKFAAIRAISGGKTTGTGKRKKVGLASFKRASTRKKGRRSVGSIKGYNKPVSTGKATTTKGVTSSSKGSSNQIKIAANINVKAPQNTVKKLTSQDIARIKQIIDKAKRRAYA